MNKSLSDFFKTPASKITSYDILKTVAIALMVIDHIGYYFYPLDMDFRALGRLCVPIWLFLIGHAQSRRIDTPLIAAAIFLTVLNYARLGELSTITILATMIIVRLTLNPIMRWTNESQLKLAFLSLIFFALAPLTRTYVEYGTIAYLLAIWGHMMRNGFSTQKEFPFLYGIIALAAFLVIESMSFRFSNAQEIVMALGAIPVFWALSFYLPKRDTVPQPDSPWIRKALSPILSWTGHHTLFLYVVHLTLFRLIWMVACHCDGGCICLPLGIDPARLLH